MKTAMQELIEYLEKDYYINELTNFGKDKIKFLEKEKEQIIDAMEKTAMYVSAASLDKEIGKMNFEDFYNQTYNQKIPELLYKDGTSMRKVKLGKEAKELLDEATKRFNQPNL
jgi:hypothetical protein